MCGRFSNTREKTDDLQARLADLLGGILPDLAGFETARDSVDVFAQKIAAAVVPTTS
jgi:hypothetical protein